MRQLRFFRTAVCIEESTSPPADSLMILFPTSPSSCHIHSPCVFKPRTFYLSLYYSLFFLFWEKLLLYWTASCHTLQEECIFNSSMMTAVLVFRILILWRLLQFNLSVLQTTYLFLCLLLLHLYTCCTNTLQLHWSLWSRTFTYKFLKQFHLLSRR